MFRTLPALALGLLGGWLFTLLHVPAGWVAGSMCLVGGAALLGIAVEIPVGLRTLVYAVVGTSMGSGVTADMVRLMRQWPASLTLVILSTFLSMVACSFLLERLFRWDRVTARYSATPGGLGPIMAMVMETKADPVRVATVQSIRLAMVILTMPWLTALVALSRPAVPAAAGFLTPPVMSDPAHMILCLAVSGAAGLVYRRLGLPGGLLLGAMIASALLHGTGLVEGRLPNALSVPAFVVTGAVVGSRFAGQSFRALSPLLAPAICSSLLAILLSALFAWAGAMWLGFPFEQLWIAYAPGGIEPMMIMGFSLGLDTAFIGAHHLLRILGIGLILPAWAGPRNGKAVP